MDIKFLESIPNLQEWVQEQDWKRFVKEVVQRNLMKGRSVEKISQVTGLPLEEVIKIKDELSWYSGL